MEDNNYLETLRLNLIDAYGADNVPDSATFVSKMSNPKYREDVHFNLVDAYGTDNVPDIKTFNLKIGEVEKKKPIGNATPTGGKVGASEIPSIGSSPFLQKAKERAEQGEPTVLSVKKETVKEVGLPAYTPTKEEELKAPTQKQFEQQAALPTYEKETALDINKKQTQVAIERSKALDELIKSKKEAQSSYEKVKNLDSQIESFEPQFEKFKTTAEAFQPDIQEYKNLTSKIAEIKNKSNSFVLEYNNEYQKIAPKLESYKLIFENEKLPNEKRQDAYENYNGIVSIFKNKEKLLDQAVAQNEQGIGDLEVRAKSFDETIKKATANQAGFSQLYSQYKSLIDERNKSAEGLGVYEKRMSDAQNQIKQKLFEQSQLEDVRQQKLEKEYSTWQNLIESLPKMGIEAVAGVSDMLNVLGAFGDQEFPENNEQIREEVRANIGKLRKFGDSFITQELPKNYEKLFEGDFSLKKLANVSFNAIASTVPTIAAGLIGGPAAGVAAGAGMAFGESKEIMKEAGLTEEQAEAAAFGLSIPIGLLENYGAEDIVKLFSKEAVEYSTKIFLKNIAGRTLTKEQLFNEAKNVIGQIIKDGAPQLFKEGVKESLTEVSQGAVNEVAKQSAQEFTGVDLDENMSWSDYLKEQAEVRGEEAIGGFLGGTSMQTIGLGLKSAGEGIFPTFNPSAYQKALELIDPSKMEAFSQEVQQEVQDKVLTQEQADLAFRNIQLIQETNKLIPATINNKDLRTEALNLLIEKKEAQKEIEGKDDALVAPQKARIEEINKRLSDIANGKEEEVVTPTVTLNKNTTPTEEKYGTIDRGDGKGIVDLTRAEYEAEMGKMDGLLPQSEPKRLVPIDFNKEYISEVIDSQRQFLEKEILSETEYLKERESKKGRIEKVLDRLSGVTYDDYLKKQQNRLSLLNKDPLAYFEKELADEKKWQKKHPDDANEGYMAFVGEMIDNLKNQTKLQPTATIIAETPESATMQGETVTEVSEGAYNYQDKNAEPLISKSGTHKGFSFKWNNDEWRYRFENAGDIIRELTKYKDGNFDLNYIYEKVNALESFFKRNPNFSETEQDAQIIEKLKREYEKLPTNSEAQAEAKKLILNLLNGNIDEAKSQIEYFDKFRDDNAYVNLKQANTAPSPTATIEPTATEEEKGESIVPGKTDKAYQEAQGVTERVSKAHPEASVLVLPKGNDLSLTALYVGKEKRGKGIGSGVLESVKAEADKLGKKVVLDTTNELDEETDLERLGEFYERNGFVKVGENKFEYTPNINQNKAGQEQVAEPLKDVESTAKALEGVDKIKLLSQSGLIDKSERTSYKSYNVGDVISGNQLDELSGDLVGNQPNKKFVLVQTSLSNFSENREQLLKEEKGYEEEEADRLESMKENFNKTPPIPMQGDGRHRIISAKELGHKTILMWQEASSKSISEAYHADKAAGKETELTKAVEQLLTPNINQNETVNENVREIGNGQKDGQKGDVSQEAKSDVQEGEEKVAEGEEPTAEQVDKASKAVGTTPSNLRDLYRISRDLFGQSKDRALASAIAMDRMIGAMAKRAGILKQRMYEKLQFRKDTEANVLKADNALFQGMVDGKPVTLRNMDVDVVNGFYSPIEKNLMEYGKDKIKAKDWLNVVGKSDEAVFTGVRAFLEGKDPNAMVGKQEILDYMKDNRISVVEVVLKEGEGKTAKERFGKNIELEGEKENYKEVLVTLPSRMDVVKDYNFKLIDYNNFVNSLGSPTLEERQKADAMKSELDVLKSKLPKEVSYQQGFAYLNDKFQSTHFDEPNILVHLRMNTRTDADGNKVLFLEEVQSDWGQTGKKEGFAKSEKEIKDEYENADKAYDIYLNEIETKYGKNFVIEDLSKSEYDKYAELANKRANLGLQIDSGRIQGQPTAPFVMDTNAWTKLGLKVALKEAVAQGVDKIAWTTGEQQNERYDLSKQVDYIDYWRNENGTYGFSLPVEFTKPSELTASELENYLGKEVAKKIIDNSEPKIITEETLLTRSVAEGYIEQGKDVYYEIDGVKKGKINSLEQINDLKFEYRGRVEFIGEVKTKEYPKENKPNRLEGDGLKVGGKGMKGFYGSMEEGTKGIVGGVAEKLFGQKVGTTTLQGEKPITTDNTTVEIGNKSYVLKNENGDSLATMSFETGDNFSKKDLHSELVFLAKKYAKKEVQETTQPSIDVTPALRAEVIRGLALFQRQQGQQAKGAMVAADGTLIIYALSDPNVSTPLHEMAHVFEHYLTESERQTIIRNAGTGAWTTETSEYFARGFEKYLAEGVAPTKELQKVFEKFKEWLTEIYNGITGSEIDIQLNDEMRAIYAQMFGEEEVNSKFKPNEKITQKEDGKPLPKGVSGVRTETEERKTSPELRPQEEEVRSIIDNAVANFYAINEATKRSEKREAAKEYRQNLEKMPTVKNIFDNIKTIFAQLEAEGVITKSKDCP